MAVSKKVKKKPKPDATPNPRPLLGTGIVGKTADKIIDRRRRMCIADGGKWVNGNCVY